MEEGQFWAIIESDGLHTSDDVERQLDAIRGHLGRLEPEELVEFHRILTRKLADAYTWNLWGAAYLINGGCSDDGFAYFREWLVARGRATYEAALRDPDTLAGTTDPERDDYELEGLWYLPRQLYEARAGAPMPPTGETDGELTDPEWDFEDDEEMARRFPKLAGIYLD